MRPVNSLRDLIDHSRDKGDFLTSVEESFDPCECGATDWYATEGVGFWHGYLILTCEKCGQVEKINFGRDY